MKIIKPELREHELEELKELLTQYQKLENNLIDHGKAFSAGWVRGSIMNIEKELENKKSIFKKLINSDKNIPLVENCYKKKYIKYERINFFNYFRNNGYVKKILYKYYDDKYRLVYDVVYYNDRSRTEVPCLDKEVFIISDHKEGINTYTLVQVDFSVPLKFKIIMISNYKQSESNSKSGIYEYIIENNMVEVKENVLSKKPQIDFEYGTILLEVFEKLKDEFTIEYSKERLLEFVLENINLSEKYLNFSEEDKVFMYRRIGGLYGIGCLNVLFDNFDSGFMSMDRACKYIKEYQENYYYNI